MSSNSVNATLKYPKRTKSKTICPESKTVVFVTSARDIGLLSHLAHDSLPTASTAHPLGPLPKVSVSTNLASPALDRIGH